MRTRDELTGPNDFMPLMRAEVTTVALTVVSYTIGAGTPDDMSRRVYELHHPTRGCVGRHDPAGTGRSWVDLMAASADREDR